jgi:hypothetical protein
LICRSTLSSFGDLEVKSLISKTQVIFGAIILVAMSAALSAFVFSNWDPFPPTDYEDCAGRAAKTAKSKDGLSVLLSLCRSEFKGRRKPICYSACKIDPLSRGIGVQK